MKRIFRLRYAIDSLNLQLKDETNKQSKMQKGSVAYRGAKCSVTALEALKSTVGNLIAKVSFLCGYLNENQAKCFATGDMKNPYKQPILQKLNIPATTKEETYPCLFRKDQTSDEDVVILSYLPLFRIEKMERTELYWYLEAILIDEEDEEFRSLIGPWAQLIDEQCQFQSGTHQTYFRYLDVNNTSFLRFQVLVDALLRLEPDTFAKEELIEFCRSKYTNNTKTLHDIDIFEQTYRSEDAISWYSSNRFLFRVLNDALRQEDHDTIIKLRYFIHDLHNQLAKLQIDYLRSLSDNQINLVVYRGQTMPNTVLECIKQHQCSLISMNSFLSTTANYDVAKWFSGGGIAEIEKGHVSVIFEISVDTRQPLIVPFARIDSQSKYKDEEEILFSMAAVFRIQNVEKIDDKLWHVKLMLDRNTDDEQWFSLTSHLND
jgi:hypothetical protein